MYRKESASSGLSTVRFCPTGRCQGGKVTDGHDGPERETDPATGVADVVRRLHPRIVLPMHWFTPENLASFLALMAPDFEIVSAIGPEVEISADTLPDHPTVLVLEAALIP